MKEYYVYIMASRSGVLYIGVTSNLNQRVFKHKNETIEGFSQKYKTKKLVYFEVCTDVEAAITREKQLKGWRRSKKDALIDQMNPEWRDLSRGWDVWERDPSTTLGMTKKSRDDKKESG